MPATDHEYLIGEISQIATDERHKEFLELLNQKQYNKALVLGCKNSNPEDTALTKMLLALLRYAQPLSLNLQSVEEPPKTKRGGSKKKGSHAKDVGLTPADYAIENKNFNLYFYLDKAGAKADDSRSLIWLIQMQNALQKALKHSQEYFNEQTQIDLLPNDLPLKKTFATDLENAKYDNQRLLSLLKIIKHLATYYKDLNDVSFVACLLDSFEKEIFYNHRVNKAREYGVHISKLVANLSDSIRKKYDEFLKPLSWFALEQLGGILQQNNHGLMLNIIFNAFNINEDNAAPNVNFSTIMRFFEECQDTEELIEQALPDIAAELPKLDSFLRAIYMNEVANAGIKPKPDFKASITPFSFSGIRTAIHYFNELRYLNELLSLLSYQNEQTIRINYNASTMPSMVPNTRKMTEGDLATKMSQHAFLRKLQRLGEILNRKNLNLREINNTIDYEALIYLRDCICHQDTRHNKFIVDELLREQSKLKKIFDTDLPELFSKIESSVSLREQRYGAYDQNVPKYWQQVMHAGQGLDNLLLPQENKNKYTGLNTIRELAARFKSIPQPRNFLSPLKRIDAAIDALSNIKEFLEDVGYFEPNLLYKSMEEWDNYRQPLQKENLVSLALDNHSLNDALEYNAGQLLQHLDTIRKYDEAGFCIHLRQGYPALRALRNYIEHGHPLIESHDDEFNRDSPYSGQRQKIILPELIKLVFELLPDLQQIKSEIKKKQIPVAPKVSSSGSNFWVVKKIDSANNGPEKLNKPPQQSAVVKQGVFKTSGTAVSRNAVPEVHRNEI